LRKDELWFSIGQVYKSYSADWIKLQIVECLKDTSAAEMIRGNSATKLLKLQGTQARKLNQFPGKTNLTIGNMAATFTRYQPYFRPTYFTSGGCESVLGKRG